METSTCSEQFLVNNQTCEIISGDVVESVFDNVLDLMRFMEANWNEYGLSPLMLSVLLERYTYAEIYAGMAIYLGEDFTQRKVTSWINSLEEYFGTFPDELPVYEVLCAIVEEGKRSGTA